MLKTPGDEFKSAGQFEDPEFGFDLKNIRGFRQHIGKKKLSVDVRRI